MSWQTPKTDRTGPEPRTTATDMNRIAGNLNAITGESYKDDYTNTDIVLKTDWLLIVNTVHAWNSDVTASTDWINLNLIESTMEEVFNRLLFPADDLYPSDSLYPAD